MTLSVQPAIAIFDTARAEACGVAPVGVADPTFFAPITKVQREAGGVRGVAVNDAGQMVDAAGTVGGAPLGVVLNVFRDMPPSVVKSIVSGSLSVDCSPFIQSAIDKLPYGGVLLLPAGAYKLSNGLRISKSIKIIGDTMVGTVLYVDPSLSSDTDVITLTPNLMVEGLVFEDFSILPISGTPGRHCVFFDVSAPGVGYSKVNIARCYFRAKNGNAIKVYNPNLDHDAFFTSTIEYCVLSGGVDLLGAGDSINIHKNVINIASGALPGGINPGVKAKIISNSDPLNAGNSKLLSIAFNNIVATEAVRIDAGVQTHILWNNMEGRQGVSAESVDSALINLAGDSTHVLEGCVVYGNYVGANHAVQHGIRLDFCINTIVTANTIAPSGGVWNNYPIDSPKTYAANWKGISQTANSLYADIGKNTFPYSAWSGNEQNVLSGAGQCTLWQPSNIASKNVTTSGSYTIALQDAMYWLWNIATASAFSIADPLVFSGSGRVGPIQGGFKLTFAITNNSGGAMGAITWGSAYKLSGAFVNPAAGKTRVISFFYTGSAWIESDRSANDI